MSFPIFRLGTPFDSRSSRNVVRVTAFLATDGTAGIRRLCRLPAQGQGADLFHESLILFALFLHGVDNGTDDNGRSICRPHLEDDNWCARI